MKWRHRQKLLQWWGKLLAFWEWWRSDPQRMLKHSLVVLAAIWGVYGLQTWACSLWAPYEGPSWDPSGSARWAVGKYDEDGDRAIGPGELDNSPGLKACLERADLNKDGKLDRDEIDARLRFYRECRAYLLKTVCRVTFEGKPLADATVRFVPDRSIRGSVEPAEGITDEEGRAEMSTEDRDDLGVGVQPGMYSVEISLMEDSGQEMTETLPARYNTRTTLGYEAAPDGGPAGLEPEFDLVSEQEPLTKRASTPDQMPGEPP